MAARVRVINSVPNRTKPSVSGGEPHYVLPTVKHVSPLLRGMNQPRVPLRLSWCLLVLLAAVGQLAHAQPAPGGPSGDLNPQVTPTGSTGPNVNPISAPAASNQPAPGPPPLEQTEVSPIGIARNGGAPPGGVVPPLQPAPGET